MNDYKKPCGHEDDQPDAPAEQPKPPTDGENCEKPEPTIPPEWQQPGACWTHDPCCKCSSGNGSSQNCLQGLIDEQQDLIVKQAADATTAENATKFQAVLGELLKNTQAAGEKYTPKKYGELVQEWKDQDADIAGLIHDLVCVVRCWKCVLDCHVCPLINDIYVAEKSLDAGQLYSTVHDLHDLQYWYSRNKDAKKRTFERIENTLGEWTKPVDVIADTLKINKDLTTKARSFLGTEAGKAIFDVFMVLIPRHLAIAPPANKIKTKIHRKYTEICKCEEIEPKNCCGPDVGPWILRMQSIQPKPYLIDPDDYSPLICCLVKNFYVPAKDDLSEAEAGLANVGQQIAKAEKAYKEGLEKFAENANATIPHTIDCCKYEKHDDGQQQQQNQQQQQQHGS
jgi:hypothetical protein